MTRPYRLETDGKAERFIRTLPANRPAFSRHYLAGLILLRPADPNTGLAGMLLRSLRLQSNLRGNFYHLGIGVREELSTACKAR